MDLRKEIITAFYLLVLLCLLYYSFTWNTWNLSPDHGMLNPGETSKTNSEGNTEVDSKDVSMKGNKRYIFQESFKTVKYYGNNGEEVSVVGDSLLPSFNSWKEKELSKQGKNEGEEMFPNKPRSPRRKLNYASSKCGAKILVSNSESKYPKYILNEKIDEYMLNPCTAKAWFVIELCDAIEATQIELANYELYSSSPKKFFVFWSEVYPTRVWKHLGTFQAEEQRTTQTFDLEVQNFGKFVKVIIFSHHGGEHFCPLSVFRVLGYSMVYEFEEIEKRNTENNGEQEKNGTLTTILEESKKDPNATDGNTLGFSKQLPKNNTITLKANKSRNIPDSFWTSTYQEKLRFCSYSILGCNEKTCLYGPYCEFLAIVSTVQNGQCINSSCDLEVFEMFHNSTVKTEENIFQENNSTSSTSNHNLESIKSNFSIEGEKNIEFNNTLNFHLNNSLISKEPSLTTNSSNRNTTIKDLSGQENNQNGKNTQPDELTNLVNSNNDTKLSEGNGSCLKDVRDGNSQLPHGNSISNAKDSCQPTEPLKSIQNFEKYTIKNIPDANSSTTSMQGSSKSAAESAALIQKESVLVKLTQRIKSLEFNLNLINTYLQHLSESYRHQMSEIQAMFNGAVEAIHIQSDEASAVVSDLKKSLRFSFP